MFVLFPKSSRLVQIESHSTQQQLQQLALPKTFHSVYHFGFIPAEPGWSQGEWGLTSVTFIHVCENQKPTTPKKWCQKWEKNVP